MGWVLVALEALDRELQAVAPVPYQGSASLHASIISGGHEISIYPDECVLQMERRTVDGEDARVVSDEISRLLSQPATRIRLSTPRPKSKRIVPLTRSVASSGHGRGSRA
jgi:acetylornithine deacetylase